MSRRPYAPSWLPECPTAWTGRHCGTGTPGSGSRASSRSGLPRARLWTPRGASSPEPTPAVGGGRSTPHALSSRRQIDPRARLPPRPTARCGRTTDYGGSVSEDRRVAVIGLGYVGLPLAIAFTEAGLEVEGIDALPSRVTELCAGTSPIDDVSDERLRAALNAGLRITGPATAGLRDDEAVCLCVPTPVTST